MRRVEAVCLVDDGDAGVAGLGEDDVDALLFFNISNFILIIFL